MKIKTKGFAAALAVLLALSLVFVMPVGATYSGSGSGTEQNPYIAMSFDNMTEAFQLSANSDDTIYVKLGASFSSASSLTVPKNITLDLAGYTITATDTITDKSFGFINLQPGSTFILEDSVGGGKITLTATENRGWNAYSSVISVQRANATINGGTIQHLGGTDMAYGIDVLTNTGSGDAKLVVNGGSIISTYRGVRLFENSAYALCSIEVNEGSISGNNAGVWCQDANGYVNPYSVKVSGGYISGNLNGAILISGSGVIDTVESGLVEITGGTLTSSSEYGTIYIKNMDDVKSGFELIVGPDVVIENTGNGPVVSGVDAKIGDKYYVHFSDAINAMESGDTITLLRSTEGTGIIIDSGKNVVIDFNGYTYTVTDEPLAGSEGTKTQAFQLLKDSTITMKNGAIVGDNESVKMLIQNYADLTLENMVLDATQGNNNVLYVLSNNNGNVVITGDTDITAPEGKVAFDVCYYASYPSVTVTFDEKFTGTVTGNIEHTNYTSIAEPDYKNNAKLIIKAGTFNGAFSTVNDGANIVITGGTFSSNPSAYIASGYEVVQPGDKYLVQKYVDRSSSSSSSKPVEEPEEPEQPEEPVVEPETPAAPGEATVETEVTDGGEVEFEAPVEEPGVEGGSAAADEDEAKITGVVLPTGTDSEVTFVPVSEQPAPAGQEENTKKVFEINVPSYEKGKAAVIKFHMTVAELAADGKEAADVALWHFDEETGEWTKLVTSYVIVDGVVYFEAITNDFSPFAIIYEDEPAGDMPGNETQDEPETPETPASPAPLLGVLAALGAAVVLRRK